MEEGEDITDQGPGKFLENLAAKLNAVDGVDGDLAAILNKHILVETPADTCVANARADIVALAKRRATPPAEPGDA